MKISFNNRFIVEPYQSEHQIKSTSGTGFAMIQQKVSLKGLKLLVPVQMNNWTKTIVTDNLSQSYPVTIPKGSIIYVKEEVLYSQPWAKAIYQCEGLNEKFIIVDQSFVEFIDIPDIQTFEPFEPTVLPSM